MKTFDISEFLSDFSIDGEMKNGDKILITIDGKKICEVEPKFDIEEVEFKVTKKY